MFNKRQGRIKYDKIKEEFSVGRSRKEKIIGKIIKIKYIK